MGRIDALHEAVSLHALSSFSKDTSAFSLCQLTSSVIQVGSLCGLQLQNGSFLIDVLCGVSARLLSVSVDLSTLYGSVEEVSLLHFSVAVRRASADQGALQ